MTVVPANGGGHQPVYCPTSACDKSTVRNFAPQRTSAEVDVMKRLLTMVFGQSDTWLAPMAPMESPLELKIEFLPFIFLIVSKSFYSFCNMHLCKANNSAGLTD